MRLRARGVTLAGQAAAYNPPMPEEDDSLERAIAGALRDTIRQHGPITLENMNSAIKRVAGNLRNAKIRGLAAVMARRRWASVSKEDRSQHQSAAAKSMWGKMNPTERAEFLRRRGLAIKKARRRPPE